MFRPVLALAGLIGVLIAQPSSADVAVVISSRSGAFGQATRTIQKDLGSRAQLLDISAQSREEVSRELATGSAKVTLAVGPAAARLAQSAAPDRPMVFCLVPGAGRRGFDKSSSRGVPLLVQPKDLLQELRAALPDAKRVSAIYEPSESTVMAERASHEAKRLGFTLTLYPLTRAGNASVALKAAFEDADAVWLLPDRAVSTRESIKFMLLKSFERKIPVVAPFEAFAHQGALMAVMPDPAAQGAAAAALARAVADGARLGEASLKHAQPRTVLNLRTAKRLGLRVPDAFVLKASTVIK